MSTQIVNVILAILTVWAILLILAILATMAVWAILTILVFFAILTTLATSTILVNASLAMWNCRMRLLCDFQTPCLCPGRRTPILKLIGREMVGS